MNDIPPRQSAETQARELRTAIAARLRRGESLDCVDRELIAPSRLSEQQKSALWLYGWSLPQRALAHEADTSPPESRWGALAVALHPRRHLSDLARRQPQPNTKGRERLWPDDAP